ncbi:MAG TPA: TIGR03667 family PPOX class F420-dependent oxidoreductase [Thermomicrobiales bacterium]|nr:TIGR03667 family PPOX class F420-dependent oxidoreductase [Thermomicrobiales bacterium]
MTTTLDRSTQRGQHVERRLNEDVIAWLTTVRPTGQPDSVPVWFLWQNDKVVVYSRPDQTKLRNLAENPKVTLTLDNTNGGSDVIRIEGTAEHDADYPACHEVPAYVEKYAERISYIGYGSPENFARTYSAAIVVTPTRFRV